MIQFTEVNLLTLAFKTMTTNHLFQTCDVNEKELHFQEGYEFLPLPQIRLVLKLMTRLWICHLLTRKLSIPVGSHLQNTQWSRHHLKRLVFWTMCCLITDNYPEHSLQQMSLLQQKPLILSLRFAHFFQMNFSWLKNLWFWMTKFLKWEFQSSKSWPCSAPSWLCSPPSWPCLAPS